MSEGLAGGYPGAPNAYLWHGKDDAAETQSVDWGVFPLQGRDVLEVRWNGGGGIGDPLMREAEAVCRDVRAGVVSAEAAHAVYAVVLDESGALDEAATRAHRQGRIETRRPERPVNGEAPAEAGLRLSSDEQEVLCAGCGHLLSQPGEAWKNNVESQIRDLCGIKWTATPPIHRSRFASSPVPGAG